MCACMMRARAEIETNGAVSDYRVEYTAAVEKERVEWYKSLKLQYCDIIAQIRVAAQRAGMGIDHSHVQTKGHMVGFHMPRAACWQ